MLHLCLVIAWWSIKQNGMWCVLPFKKKEVSSDPGLGFQFQHSDWVNTVIVWILHSRVLVSASCCLAIDGSWSKRDISCWIQFYTLCLEVDLSDLGETSPVDVSRSRNDPFTNLRFVCFMTGHYKDIRKGLKARLGLSVSEAVSPLENPCFLDLSDHCTSE